MSDSSTIDPVCHVPKQDIMVHGSRMRYLSAGHGTPIVFVHGIPTYSYLWRNIIPAVQDLGHCIAPDLIGMGESDKPKIQYTIDDHLRYFEGFLDALGLSDIILVMHGFGSIVGLDFATRHPDRVKAVSLYEAFIQPSLASGFSTEALSLPVQQLAFLLQKPIQARKEIVDRDYFMQKFMLQAMVRRLSPQELAEYQRPFNTPKSRELLWQFVSELPISAAANPAVTKIIQAASAWLVKTAIPKQLLYAMPGYLTPISTVAYAKTHWPHLSLSELPDAMHFAQETDPAYFAEQLHAWLLRVIP